MAITQDPTVHPSNSAIPSSSSSSSSSNGHANSHSSGTSNGTHYKPYPGGRYISPSGAESLRSYKYSGADLSLLYIYILTPMNKFLIQYVPLWMAPNLITFIGLLVTISAHALTVYYAPGFTSTLPSWGYIYIGLSLFAYQTIDNLDGRQARRTGASSPLGLLFDHGVDALNTTVSALTVAAIYDYECTWRLYALWSLTIIPFMFATWEEYYTGELILPIVNGPSDGVMIVISFIFLGYFYPGFWLMNFGEAVPILKGTIISDVRAHMFVIVVGYVGLIPTIGTNILAVYRTVGGHHGSDVNVTGEVSFIRKLATLLPFISTWAIGALWAYFSPSQVFVRHPRIFLFSLGFLFCNLICKLMLAHLCNQEYYILRSVMIPLVLLSANSIIPGIMGITSPLNEDYAITLHCICTFIFWAHFVYHVIGEITTILHIKCFTIDYEKAVRTNAALCAADAKAKKQ